MFFVQLNWLSVDFNNWKDWEDDSDEELSSFDRFSEVHVYIYTAINNLKLYNVKKIILVCVYLILKMMNNMGGEDDLPDVDGADDVRELLKPFYIYIY